MIKHYESIQGEHAAICQKMNEVSEFCKEINFINSTPAMIGHQLTNQQVPGLLCLIEFTFESEIEKEKFEYIMKPQKLSIVN